MSRLSVAEQEGEIRESFAELERITGSHTILSFSYPYGGPGTFTVETEALLRDAGCMFAFSTQPGAVSPNHMRGQAYSLPRIDCNSLPHGAAHCGSRPPHSAESTEL